MLGTDQSGAPVRLDIEELLATRLLVQGNSGSGKSHLLRRVLEESANLVQQVVIDPEGDFVSLAEPFGHVVVDGAAYTDGELARLAQRIREHRASVVLALDNLEVEGQMRCAALFLSALFNAPQQHWYPALVVVDEAQLFAPAGSGEVSDEARRLSLAAMTNLMCRGRKRGLAGLIATQRLAKLAKNVAAEASNLLMGRTFLDIDMARAADLLGLGPAVSRRPVAVRIGPVRTRARATSSGLMPPPAASRGDMETLLHAPHEEPAAPVPPLPAPPPVEAVALHERIASFELAAESDEPTAELDPRDRSAAIREVLRAMAAEEGCTFQPVSALFLDFNVRCRMRGLREHGLDTSAFRRRLALAVAGFDESDEDEQARAILQLARGVPEELLAPFLAIARAAAAEEHCPDDDELARIYGTSSPARARRMLDYLEKGGHIVVRTDFGGRRTVAIPGLNLSTLPV